MRVPILRLRRPRLLPPVGQEVRVPLSQVDDGKMHLFTVNVSNQTVRFMIIKKPDGYGTALDACRICGAEGYRQDGQNVVCRHCGSAIYVPSIGDQGGCNPIGVASHIDGGDIVIDLSSLDQSRSRGSALAAEPLIHSSCFSASLPIRLDAARAASC